MNRNWYLSTVKLEKNDDGTTREVTEQYLVDALSFTEAEARTIEYVRPYIVEGGSLKVKAMKEESILEVYNQEKESADRWYKVKINEPYINENGKKKNSYSTMMVKGGSVNDAESRLHEGMEGTLCDYEIASIVETKILDVIFYNLEKESDVTR